METKSCDLIQLQAGRNIWGHCDFDDIFLINEHYTKKSSVSYIHQIVYKSWILTPKMTSTSHNPLVMENFIYIQGKFGIFDE